MIPMISRGAFMILQEICGVIIQYIQIIFLSMQRDICVNAFRRFTQLLSVLLCP